MSLTAQTDAQLNEQRTIRREHKQTYQLMGGITLVVIGIWIGAQLFGSDAGFTINIYTEALSVLVTVLVIKWFDDRRATNQRKQELSLQLGSQSNDFALEAKRQLEQLGWLDEAYKKGQFVRANWKGAILTNGNLNDVNLMYADLTETELIDANFVHSLLMDAKFTGARIERADFSKSLAVRANFSNSDLPWAKFIDTNLDNANFSGASMNSATLIRANLRRAKLRNTLLVEADLSNACLKHADLTSADLCCGDLLGTDLANADLTDTWFDTGSILPDGTYWTPDTDMARFTDPAHPQFWRSDDPASPAYGGG